MRTVNSALSEKYISAVRPERLFPIRYFPQVCLNFYVPSHYEVSHQQQDARTRYPFNERTRGEMREAIINYPHFTAISNQREPATECMPHPDKKQSR